MFARIASRTFYLVFGKARGRMLWCLLGFILIPNMCIFGLSIQNLRLEIGDLVQYELPATGGTNEGKSLLGIGLIMAPVIGNRLQLYPLCCREGDARQDSEIMLVEDEDKGEVIVEGNRVHRVIPDYYFSQRPIEDRKLNPHGEHSEDVWLVKTELIDIERTLLRYRGESY